MARKRTENILFQRDCYTEADYEMWREDNELEPTEYTENEFYDWLYQQEEWDFEDMLDNLKYSKLGNTRCLIEGGIGTWRGTFEIEQTTEWSIKDAILRCIRGAEVQEIKVVGHAIEICTAHHDGRNYFTIHFLSELGAERFDRNGVVSMNNYKNFLKIPKYFPF